MDTPIAEKHALECAALAARRSTKHPSDTSTLERFNAKCGLAAVELGTTLAVGRERPRPLR
jgi:hypothetical protein